MRRRSLFSRLYQFTWRYKMTPAGKILTGLFALTSIGTISTQVPVYQVCCALLGLLAAAELLGLIAKPFVSVTANWPRTLEVGQPATVHLRVTNSSTWRAAYDLMLLVLGQPKSLKHLNGDQYVGKLKPKQSVDMQVELLPSRRGRWRVRDIDVHSTFPFNLVRIPGGRTGPRELIVLPAAQPLVRFEMPVDEGAAAGQFVLSGQVGESTEYLGNREYAPGEPVRRLDFRAWARLGKPIVREYQDEFASKIGLIVDTVAEKKGWFQRDWQYVEEAVSVAASVIDSVLEAEYQFALMATGSDLYTFTEENDRLQRDELLERLALCLPTPVPVYDAMLDSILAESEQCAAMLVVLASWGEPQQRLVEQLAELGPPMKVVLVCETGDPPLSFDGEDRVCVAAAVVREGGLSVL